MVKYKGQILTDKKIYAVSINPNWNNSMAEYYPTISIYYMQNGEVCNETFETNSNDPNRVKEQLEYDLDTEMVAEYKKYVNLKNFLTEFPIVRKGKTVEVVSGRKIKIGTIGEVFWIGDSTFGTRVGLLLSDNSKVFTSLNNVKVISCNSSYEFLRNNEKQ